MFQIYLKKKWNTKGVFRTGKCHSRCVLFSVPYCSWGGSCCVGAAGHRSSARLGCGGARLLPGHWADQGLWLICVPTVALEYVSKPWYFMAVDISYLLCQNESDIISPWLSCSGTTANSSCYLLEIDFMSDCTELSVQLCFLLRTMNINNKLYSLM